MSAFVVAIDGPAASGKSSVAARVAAALSVPYINTGNMYRAVTAAVLREGLNLDPLSPVEMEVLLSKLELDYRQTDGMHFELFLNGTPCGPEIRTPEVTARVSRVAALPVVREWLLSRQRRTALEHALVMEGRDIGTTVFPDAQFKFFLTADARVRAQRRLGQGGETAAGATLESVTAEIAARDQADASRAVAPLRQAPDAVLIDSSKLTLDETVAKILTFIREA